MRYPAEHKDRVRQQIVRAAARRFRSRGGEGVAITELMRDLDLTHGGFYRHFEDKEQLFGEALAESFAQVREKMRAVAEAASPGNELEALIDAYLDERHCSNAGNGCPVAALATEIARHSKGVRATLDQGVRDHVAALQQFMPDETQSEREATALTLFTGMAGALNLARAASDPQLRRSILSGARAFYVNALCSR